MMTDTVVAVEPQEEHVKATPSAFVKDSQPPALAAAESVVLSSAETQLVRSLVRRTRAAGGDLTGPDGLLKHLTKTVIESALEEELVDHLGYDKHDPVGRNGGNSRNGYRSKTVVTDTSGEVTIDVPRDRDGSFEPRIVAKRQRRLSDLDTLVISLYSKGLTTGEISAHLLEVYGANVSKDTVSRITDKIVDDMTSW
ncbi:MAG: transposase, partial [Propionicimonas sp.]